MTCFQLSMSCDSSLVGHWSFLVKGCKTATQTANIALCKFESRKWNVVYLCATFAYSSTHLKNTVTSEVLSQEDITAFGGCKRRKFSRIFMLEVSTVERLLNDDFLISKVYIGRSQYLQYCATTINFKSQFKCIYTT